jgi:hypothetical protein
MKMDNKEYNVVAREIEKNLAGMDLDELDDDENDDGKYLHVIREKSFNYHKYRG